MTSLRFDASIHSGAGTGVVASQAVALVDRPHDHPTARLLSDALVEAVAPVTVLDRLAALGFGELPSLAIIWFAPDVRFVVRGAATVTHGSGATLASLDASGVLSWREGAIDTTGLRDLELALPSLGTDPTSMSVVPIVAGIAPARRLTLHVSPIASTVLSKPPSSEPPSPTQATSPPPPPPPPPPPTLNESEVPATRIRPTVADPRGEPDADDAGLDLAHLLGQTVYNARPDVTDADAPGPDAVEPEAVVSSPPVRELAAPSPGDRAGTLSFDSTRDLLSDEGPTSPAVAPPASTPHPPGAPGLITRVPGVSGSPIAPVDPPPPAAATPHAPGPAAHLPDEDLDDATISTAALRASLSDPLATSSDSIQAVHCASGHPNPPHNDECRVCGATIAVRTITQVSPPLLGALVFEDGQREPLDGPCVVGRNPPGDATVDGVRARVIRRPDPHRSMSRVHVEVRVHGFQVWVVDRDSMNSTFVDIPGEAPFMLPPGDPQLIPPGTVVRLGEHSSFTYEVSP